MMHDMYDLQCLNVGITSGCYSSQEVGEKDSASHPVEAKGRQLQPGH